MQGLGVRTACMWLRNFCEHGDEIWGPFNSREFVHYLTVQDSSSHSAVADVSVPLRCNAVSFGQ